MKHVLVVDDEQMIREVVTRYLADDGHRVSEAADGHEALAVIDSDTPDLVILDVMLPGPDGFSILQHIRETSDLPVILLTARANEEDRITGLDYGADDYVPKPFSARELAARVRSVLRRSRPPRGSVLSFGDLVIDEPARTATLADSPLDLTPKEFDLLAFMASRPGEAFSRQDLLREVWDSSSEWQDPATVTVHVRRLRAKIEADVDAPSFLETVWGVGYRFRSEP